MKTLSLRFTAIIAALLAPLGSVHADWTQTVLHRFTGVDGRNSLAGMVFDAAGNLYGTTVSGGQFDDGTVFMLTPPAPGQTAWTETVLHDFNGANGANPRAGVIFDGAGNLYGVTPYGGPSNYGVVFRLTPRAAGGTGWTETILHTFNGANGASPFARLVLDAAGNLYGTTSGGGSSSNGTVFRLAPPAAGMTGWTKTILHNFTGSNGASPSAGLVFDAKGNLYGATEFGSGTSSNGTIFKLAPPASGQTAWAYTMLHRFKGADGAGPYSGVIFGPGGRLYGAADGGGTFGYGAVFSLKPPAAGKTTWTETVLHNFTGADGGNPYAGVIFDTGGNLYGVSDYGGSSNYGSVFKLTPPAVVNAGWSATTIHSFTATDGAATEAGLVLDAAGNLYGTTQGVQKSGNGKVFELRP